MPQPEGHLPQVVKKREGPMPELRKRRSYLALLGVFAMVASVLAVGASSATAETGKAEAAASYSACVGPATVDAGFTDVATGSTHDAAINCIAYYGITKGTTATTFAPSQTISRWQLAVMLQRAAGPAGVILPVAQDMGFADISGMSDSFQNAINQMAMLGVMAGTTATTFDPTGIVSRATIVEALAGFLTNALVGPGGYALSRNVDRSLTVKDGTDANAQSQPIDENFRDLGGVTYSAHEAIRALAEMGVVQGRGDGTFGPAASVTRAQAAAFITRALAHTNTRPAGVTMQASKTAIPANGVFDLVISVRGNDFAPMNDAPLDIFMYPSRNAATAFKTDGTCNSGVGGVSATSGGVDVCVIEIDDDLTEPDGNLIFSATPQISENTVFWVWSGAVDDRLDWDGSSLSRDNSVVSNAASVTMTTVTVPDQAKVTTSVSKDAEGGNTVRYGTTVTVTIQLVDANGNNIGVSGQSYTWSAEGTHTPGGRGRGPSGGPGRGQLPPTPQVRPPSPSPSAIRIRTRIPMVKMRIPMPTNRTVWTYEITNLGTAVAPAANSAIGLTEARRRHGHGHGGLRRRQERCQQGERCSGSGLGLRSRLMAPPPASACTGKVTDQYGSALRNHRIFFDLDGDATFGCATPHGNLRDRGHHQRLWQDWRARRVRSPAPAAPGPRQRPHGRTTHPEMAVYRVAADLNDDDDVADTDEIAEVTHYWVLPPSGWNPDAGTGTATPGYGAISVADLDNNALVQSSIWPSPPGDCSPEGVPLHR